MPPDTHDLLQGTLDLLILRTLAVQPMHGWAIAHHLEQTSTGRLAVPAGSLYPALHRLTRRGWLKPSWGRTPENRRARFYALTAAGRRGLAAAQRQWTAYQALVQTILEAP